LARNHPSTNRLDLRKGLSVIVLEIGAILSISAHRRAIGPMSRNLSEFAQISPDSPPFAAAILADNQDAKTENG